MKGKEIGHLHGDRLFDLLMPKSERDRWIEEGKARPHHIYPDSGWVSVYLNTKQDVAHVFEIAQFRIFKSNLPLHEAIQNYGGPGLLS